MRHTVICGLSGSTIYIYIYKYIYIYFPHYLVKGTIFEEEKKLLNIKKCGNKMPTRCKRGFYCRSYCLRNMFRAPLYLSSGAQEYYAVVAAGGISCCGFQVAGLVWS